MEVFGSFSSLTDYLLFRQEKINSFEYDTVDVKEFHMTSTSAYKNSKNQ